MNNAPLTPVQIARIALVRLSEKGIAPTPDNYRRYYHEAAGIAASETPLDESSQKALAAAGSLVDDVTETTNSLLEALAGHNDGLKSTINGLRSHEVAHPLLDAVNEILRTAVAMHQSVDSSHGELRLISHSLQDIRQELNKQAVKGDLDMLTGARSQFALDGILRHCIARARRYQSPLCLAVFDLDHFRDINDQFGTPVGDRVLTHIAEVTRSSLRESDVFVRYGGEEFVVVMPETGAPGAQFVLDRLRLILQKTPLVYNGQRLHVSFSGGIAQLQNYETHNELLERAHTTMLAAKAAGRNQVLFSATHQAVDI